MTVVSAAGQTSTILLSSAVSCCWASTSREESADTNNEHCTRPRGDNLAFWAETSSFADFAASCPFAFPSTSWRRRHSTSTGQAEFIRLLSSLRPVKCRFYIINIRGQRGVSAFWMSCWTHTSWGKWQHWRFYDSLSNGSFFSYLASVGKVPDRIIKWVINTLKAFNGAG